MGRVRVGLSALAAVLVLTSCDAMVAGVATPSLTTAALGELTTLDPCSLIEPAALGAHTEPGRPGLDECELTAGEATVRVGLLRDYRSPPARRDTFAELGGGVTLGRLTGTCDTVLVLADRLTIAATATGASPRTLCRLTEAAARGVYHALVTGRVRHWTPPVTSLAVLDACAAMSFHQVAPALRINTIKVAPYPAGHRCWWGDPGSTRGAALEFPVAASPEDLGVPADAKPLTRGGRRTWVFGSGQTCTAVTEQGEFARDPGMREYARIRVTMRDPDACPHAEVLAVLAWPALPPLAS